MLIDTDMLVWYMRGNEIAKHYKVIKNIMLKQFSPMPCREK